ncbi:MAG: 3-oxoacyl-ACP reductase FabG [Deltaproteobacteria bacterium]|nr:3-oxoacyl-ACP reductase FabG [Deltaproteobacteria bacterium]
MTEKNKQRIAIVTGGSKGIGRSICIELARTGCHVVINYMGDKKGAEQTLTLVKNEGGQGEIYQFDVRDMEITEKAVDDIAKRLGSIDILINNAGIIADGLFMMMSQKNWQSVIDTSLQGFYNMTRPVIEKMVRRRNGVIVSISSASSLMANRGQANYSAAKAGLNAASKSVASEVARLGIRINVVAPGLIETDMIRDVPKGEIKAMIPMARIGKPDEVARVVGFLCSDAASYMTGQIISVNGGMF